MQDFVAGQRWISDAELQQGLGTIVQADFRSVTVVFKATGKTRTYAKETAPLTRVTFAKGDQIRSQAGWSLTVQSITTTNGLYTYHGIRENNQAAQLPESELDNQIQFNKPSDRLLTGQIDTNKWFELRYQTLRHANNQYHSDTRGLVGGRTSLIAHQLYIAHEVANRYAPRVLLADEVGLGKTIEAGLILHHQLLTERAQRVLIVVPEALVHQWLVEMLRRFNLRFSIFDEERCQAEDESSTQENPFHTEQLILCQIGFFLSSPKRFQQALNGDWDLLIVDEAHHLQWNPQQPSMEYSLVEQLAQKTKGVLLLTATPEQLGKQSHFARLKLLDGNRFSNYEAYLEEEKGYQPIAHAVEELLSDRKISERSRQILLETIKEGDNSELIEQLKSTNLNNDSSQAARTKLVEHLLDRHGTSRVLYRNTRSAIKGFPKRVPIPQPLPLPQLYEDCYKNFQSSGVTEPQLLLSPELLYQQTTDNKTQKWVQFDPRIPWLAETLKQLKPSKVLVITAFASTAMEIAEELRVSNGIHAAVFHESMSIVERDRAAAFFADNDDGTQILICSEIGSEGRNFQFAHHLILFDLPFNPDLLEQRIGRLDRIGQSHTIEIHIPYLDNSPQMILYHWYQEGLSAFENTCPAGHNVFVQVEPTLLDALHQTDEGLDDLAALVDTTRRLHKSLNIQLQQGRDRLLEFHSCRPAIANHLVDKITLQDQDTALRNYLDDVYDCHGIESEIHGRHSFVLHPGQQTELSSFPSLSEEGTTVTFDRNTALANENMQFLTWEHPLVSNAIDTILSHENGNTALCTIKHKSLSPGSLLLEAIYVLEPSTGGELQLNRYLPLSTIRIVLDLETNDLTNQFSHELINQVRNSVGLEIATTVVKSHKEELKFLFIECEKLALLRAPDIIRDAHQQAQQLFEGEIHRLQALLQISPNVRAEEIHYYQQLNSNITQILDSLVPRLDALRVLIST